MPPDHATASSSGEAPQPGPKAEHSFNYRGWEVVVQLDGIAADGCVSGHAQLHAGNYSCRLVLAGRYQDGAGAMSALARKARALIDDREKLAALSQRHDNGSPPGAQPAD
jgi:hypothetical protein